MINRLGLGIMNHKRNDQLRFLNIFCRSNHRLSSKKDGDLIGVFDRIAM